jgi:hypothetical protein
MRSVALAAMVAALIVRVGQGQRVPSPFASFSSRLTGATSGRRAPAAAAVMQSSTEHRKTHRLWLVGGLQAVGGAFAYREAVRTWGHSWGRFHVKDDWTGDGLSQNDEMSHLFVAYTLTRTFSAQWQWGGLSPGRSHKVGAFESATLMTMVEVMDAFNPAQGFGISDLVFDYAGVAAGMWSLSRPVGWGIRASAKVPAHAHLFAETLGQSDNWIFWATYRPSLGWGPRQPLSLGLGHSARRGPDGVSPVRELHFGVGTTVPDLVRAIAPAAARYVGILDCYYINVNITATLR